MFFLLIILLHILPVHMLAAYSPTTTSQYELNTKTKHTYTTFSARLIHRSSPDFPFFNPNYTRNEHIKNSVRTSIARSRYFSQSEARSATDYVAAPISGLDFYMKYTVGTPPVDRYGIIDTGSSFTWFQCFPCTHCSKQNSYPKYYPTQSSTYQQILCDTYQCNMAPGASSCWGSNFNPTCQYTIRYYGGSASQGIVSMDTLTLSADNTSGTLENLVFGCEFDNQSNEGILGVVGLSNDSSSLQRQLKVSHFSYFIFANETDQNGEAHFGPGASLSDTGANTPFLSSENGFYYLNLTGISVDGSDLDLPTGIFDKKGDNDGVIIDSGTTFTMLPSKVLEKLKEAISDQMYMYTQVMSNDWELCYKDYKGGAPEVVFQFSGLDFALCDTNLWTWDSISKSYCLAFLRSYDSMSLLGMYQQRNVQVGYDLEKNLLTLNSPEVCPEDVIDFIQ